jgi:hypothetical protein
MEITEFCTAYHTTHPIEPRNSSPPMTGFAILTNRKRAIIALIHSVVFLGVAMHGFLSPKAGILRGSGTNSDFVLVMIYMTVSSVLAWLVSVSGVARERFYFALCTCSAGFGLLRAIFGDASLPVAQYMRAIMLASAVAVGAAICRSFSTPVEQDAESE